VKQKRVDREQTSRENKIDRERERERERETEHCCKRVMAWAINLTVGTNIYDSWRRIILDPIKMDI